MSSSPVPPESSRAAGAAELLRAYGLPESAPADQLRALTRVAAALCGSGTAVVNLLDESFQHQVGAVGFCGATTSVADSLCAVALGRPALQHVPDAGLEPAFAGNPWVDGRIGNVRFYASAPIVLTDGRAIGSLCVFADEPGHLSSTQQDALGDLARQAAVLIEQAQLAREAAGQAALFRLVADGSADVLCRLAPSGAVRYVSPSLRNVLGHEPATDVPAADLLRIHVGDLDEVQDAMRRVLSRGRSASVLFRAWHADGSTRWLEARIAPIRGEDGSVTELHSAARDVTERVRAAQELAQVAEQAAGLVETCADALVSIDEDNTVVDWNPAATQTFGWTREEAIGQELSDLIIPAEMRAQHRAGLARLRAGGAATILGKQVQVTGQRRDGSRLPVELTLWRSRGRDGWRCNAFLRDVTERVAAEAELTEARDQALASTRAKTAFLAAASHEIRTPLNGVLGTLELLELEQLTATQTEYVAVARRSGEALLRLLNDVLDLSKAETTAVELTSEVFSPGDVARDVTAAMLPVAARKGLSVVLDAQVDECLVGDPGRLRQVLMNLVGNAVKFTAEGQVTVAVEFGPADGERARLRMSVRDTGAGMSADEQAGLFQPFSQGAQGQRYGGTGLGLALSQQLVELMGGRLDVQSAPGAGSTFVVEVDLPRAGRAPEAAPGGTPAAVDTDELPAGRRAPRVLVADDSETNLMVASALLGSIGADVVTVEDGDEAVAAVRREHFDLVLLDNQMPRMSGIQAATAIRALPGPAGATRLVALTASTGEDQRAAFEAAGVQGFLSKPVRLADFRQLLEGATAGQA
ncbi:PAS domain S-box protein [Blastococcus sp. TBT05-19]|uniref:PAS domain S-box protein n=1 Tax=Blastococcus sp. TBT05-19 TaxID=2250581 RepID=UPI000DE9D0C6|nr:PAS domain S-box protein [Blastococcus sp. TBT05-19]